jgi:hypothetical protein
MKRNEQNQIHWVGVDWNETKWIEFHPIHCGGLDWDECNWRELSWIELNWIKMDWNRLIHQLIDAWSMSDKETQDTCQEWNRKSQMGKFGCAYMNKTK